MQFGIRFVRSRNDIWTFCKAKDLGLAEDIGLNIIDEYIKFRGVENEPDKHTQIMYHLDDTVEGLEDTLRLQFGIEMARKAGVFDTVSQVLVDVSKMPHLSSAFSWKFTKSNRIAYINIWCGG